MRKSKLTAEEIEETERAADERKYRRGMGFDLMSVRDRGGVTLSNGSIMEWYVSPEKREQMTPYPGVEPGFFLLDGVAFDADDFRKYLRWV